MVALLSALFGALVMAALCMASEWSTCDDERKRRIEVARRRDHRSVPRFTDDAGAAS